MHCGDSATFGIRCKQAFRQASRGFGKRRVRRRTPGGPSNHDEN
ncbi:hypothetical protein BSU04_23920 [Caballeronia sordidicola]|uniref:Uncharacterized protein n=1 Tax=Caballeronia sordidicola TaxID=196367 RepID=A0A226WZI9_CABSO|nr:hypothetical protein BSU04_23920 [Caballeronia sordidicola]